MKGALGGWGVGVGGQFQLVEWNVFAGRAHTGQSGERGSIATSEVGQRSVSVLPTHRCHLKGTNIINTSLLTRLQGVSTSGQQRERRVAIARMICPGNVSRGRACARGGGRGGGGRGGGYLLLSSSHLFGGRQTISVRQQIGVDRHL